MGTRSVVATTYPDVVTDSVVKGRYAHWDGYPTGVGLAVWRIVQRDGLQHALHTLLEAHYGWSSVDGSPEQELGAGYTDGRFVAVPGYGVAYTTEQGQSAPDQWMVMGDQESWCEYAHVLTPQGLVLCVIVNEGRWGVLETIPWDATLEQATEIAIAAEACANDDDIDGLPEFVPSPLVTS